MVMKATNIKFENNGKKKKNKQCENSGAVVMLEVP